MANEFFIEIAGLTVSLTARTDYSKRHCADFITERKEPQISVHVTDKELEEQLEVEAAIREKNELPSFSEPYRENICLYRNIAEKLPCFDRFVFHGAAIECEGKGLIFTAPSGTGKSTHINLWKKVYGDKVTVINGDKPIIGIDEGIFTVFSSPWAGKEGWKTNTKAPIGGICILTRGKENKIRKVEPGDNFNSLMSQIYLPKDPQAMIITLDLLDRLSRSVPFYILECNISEEAAVVSHDAMVDGK